MYGSSDITSGPYRGATGGGGLVGMVVGPAKPVGAGLGVGSIAEQLAALFGNRSADSALNNNVIPNAPVIPTPATTPINGGEADRLRPFVTGASNQKAPWNKMPVVLGKVEDCYPIISANPYVMYRGRTTTLHVGMDFCYGEVVVSDVKVGGKKIEDLMTVTDEYVIQQGTALDPAIGQLYTNDAETLEVSVDMKRNEDIVRTCLQEADEIVVAFVFESGLYGTTAEVLEDGSTTTYRTTSTVSFKIEYRPTGSTGAYTTAIASFNVTDNTSSPFSVAYTFKPATKGQYDVKVRRLTSVSTNTDTVNASTYLSLTAIIYADPYRQAVDANGNPVYYARIVIGVGADKNIQGVLGQVSATLSSKFPVYAGGWSAPTETNNPAWLAAGIMRGVGGFNPRPIPDSKIDYQSFVDFAAHCEANGYTYNRIVDGSVKIRSIVDEVCSAGRGKVVKKNGQYSVVIDKSRGAITQHFNRFNTVPGSFRFRCRQTLKTHGVRVNWLDPKDKSQQAQRIAYNDGFTSANARRFEVIDLPGCRDAVQAYKRGRNAIADQELRSKTVEFTADWESLTCSVLDLVSLNHDVALYGTSAGRVLSVTTNGGGDITAITLTQGATMAPGFNYEMRIRKSDYSSVVLKVVNPGAGIYSTLTLSNPYPAASTPLPAPGDLVHFGPEGLSAKLMQVITIERQAQHFARIVCQEYQEGVYGAETGEIPDYESNSTPLPPFQEILPVPVVVSIVSDERALKVLQNDVLLSQIIFVLTPTPVKVTQIEYQYKIIDSEVWSALYVIGATTGGAGSITIEDVDDGATYDVRIRNATFYGINSDWTYQQTTVIGKTTNPPDIPILLMREGNFLKIGIDSIFGFERPLDMKGVQIRMAWGIDNAQENWDLAVNMVDLFTGDLYPMGAFATGEKTWLVKAVDVTGRMSTNAAILKVDFGPLSEANIVSREDLAPLWSGVTITGGSIVTQQIKATQLSNPAASHYKGEDPEEYYKGADSANFYADYYDAVTLDFLVVPNNVTPGSTFKLELDMDAENYRVYYAPPLTDSEHYIGEDSEAYYRSDPFWPADGAIYVPMPTDGIPASRQAYPVRIECDASQTQTIIRHIYTITDAPDVTEYLDDVVVSADPLGTTIAPTKTYLRIENIGVTLQQHPDYPLAKSFQVDKYTGPVPIIHVYDVNGDPCAGLVDVQLKGV